MQRAIRAVLLTLTSLYTVVLAWLTLGPQPRGVANTAFWFAHDLAGSMGLTLGYDRFEFLSNIALFVPLGALLILLVGRSRWWIVLLVGIAATCAIEGVQHWIPGRVPDVRDLIANSTGALLGLLLAAPFAGPRRAPRPRIVEG